MTRARRAAAVVLAAALTVPAPTVAVAAATTPQVAATVTPAKQHAKRQWRAMTKAQHRYHCYHFRADRALYGQGYRLGARLNGKSPRRARALWLGWKWQLGRKCSGVAA